MKLDLEKMGGAAAVVYYNRLVSVAGKELCIEMGRAARDAMIPASCSDGACNPDCPFWVVDGHYQNCNLALGRFVHGPGMELIAPGPDCPSGQEGGAKVSNQCFCSHGAERGDCVVCERDALRAEVLRQKVRVQRLVEALELRRQKLLNWSGDRVSAVGCLKFAVAEELGRILAALAQPASASNTEEQP